MSLGVVQRAGVSPTFVALRLRIPGETRYLLLAPEGRGRIMSGLVPAADKTAAFEGKLPAGCTADARAEDALGTAQILSVTDTGVLCHAKASASGAEQHHRFVNRAGVLVLVRDVEPKPEETPPGDVAMAALWERGPRCLAQAAAAGTAWARTQARAGLLGGLSKLDRRAAAVRSDLAKMDEASTLIDAAQWLVGLAHRAKRGSTSLTYTDWSSGEPQERSLALDPSRAPADQVEAMFRRAKRLKLGRAIAELRLAEVCEQRAALAMLLARLDEEASDVAAVQEILRAAKAAAPREIALSSGGTQAPRPRQAAARAYRTFVTAQGQVILVGKGRAHNDALTFRVARPHDLFLHVRGVPGAHVVVPLPRGETATAEVLVSAALLAAHFSDAREESVVDVTYVPKKFVRKPKGGVPGQVVFEREKVLALRVDREQLRQILEREEREVR